MGLVLVAACRLDVDVATDVRADGSGMVTVSVRADREVIAAAPGLVADLRLDDLRSAGWTVDGPSVAADGGASVTLAKAFATPDEATQVLAEIGGPVSALAVAQRRAFALVETTVDGQVVAGGLDTFADAELVQALGGLPLADRVRPEQVASGLGMTIRFTLPGSVVAADGDVDGNSVRWEPSMAAGATTSVRAVAALRDRAAIAARDRETWATRGFWAWIGMVAAVALVVGVLAWRRRRRSR